MFLRAMPRTKIAKEDLKYPGLQHQLEQSCNRGLLWQIARRFLRAQFGRPTGLFGYVAGKIMIRTPSNNERICWTISLLAVKPHDRILEIGFGPGVAVNLMSKAAVEGLVAGVDHSAVMLRQASKRNAQAIRDGRVILYLGSASRLPNFDVMFDKIVTINSIHFWTDPIDCLRALRALLKPGGTIAVTIQPRSRGAKDTDTLLIGKEIVANLEKAGFSQCRLEIKKAVPVAVACALGIN